MKIFIFTKPNSRKEGIEKISENTFMIRVKEPPIDGKANEAVIKALSKYFDKSAHQIRIVSGHTSKKKLVEIKD